MILSGVCGSCGSNASSDCEAAVVVVVGRCVESLGHGDSLRSCAFISSMFFSSRSREKRA